MYAAILHAIGEPAGTLETALEARPYVDVETTAYLDGHAVYHGTLALTIVLVLYAGVAGGHL